MNALLAHNSILHSQLQGAPTQSVGKIHPIDIPCVTINEIGETIGEKITRGDYGTIYEVDGAFPPRIYKIIPLDVFNNGDEIRISKIAGDRMLAPTFYSACLVTQNSSSFVLFEMDNAGRSLGKWMEALAAEPEKEVATPEPDLTEEEKARNEMLEKLRAQFRTGIVMTEIKKPNRLSMKEAIAKLYKSREEFYFSLFSRIKDFAACNISYSDTHCGNIMPNCGEDKGLQLIDFDGARLKKSPEKAAQKAMESTYNLVLLQDFASQENLSSESQELITWFKSHFKR